MRSVVVYVDGMDGDVYPDPAQAGSAAIYALAHGAQEVRIKRMAEDGTNNRKFAAPVEQWPMALVLEFITQCAYVGLPHGLKGYIIGDAIMARAKALLAGDAPPAAPSRYPHGDALARLEKRINRRVEKLNHAAKLKKSAKRRAMRVCKICRDLVSTADLRDHLCQHNPNAQGFEPHDVAAQFMSVTEAGGWGPGTKR